MPKVFLINLDRSPHRLQFMTVQLHSQGIDFERIRAVDGDAVPAWMADEFKGPHNLSPSEVGCYASHLVVAQRVVGDGLPYAIVLEDDATLDPAFLSTAEDAIAHAPAGWDYIHLSSLFKRTILSVAELPCGRHHLVRYVRHPVNTAAYIVSNRGARKWLNPMPRRRPNDLDNRFAWLQGLDVYGVYPAPARQLDNFAPDIDHQLRRPRDWSPGLMSRAYGRLWTLRKIGFRNYARAKVSTLLNSVLRRIDGKLRVAIIRV